MREDIINIAWHGRGGQGAITAAKIVAKTSFQTGYTGVVMVPTFGTERRGAPVMTSLKISKKKIYDLSPIENPDIAVVLDHLLLNEINIVEGLKHGAILVINTPKPSNDYSYNGIRVATADITAIAREAGLPYGMVNSGIIGAFAKASSLIGIETISDVIREEFKEIRPEENARSALLTYERTIINYGDKKM
ncbi:MAG: 2-oxoacid:acceptor oxidoreductase family protein [Deltaproteobacteria bacterium]|nr:2-oxoacid:acceptor oxidoreductase family protein [Deltaproteobacteria bacterium]